MDGFTLWFIYFIRTYIGMYTSSVDRARTCHHLTKKFYVTLRFASNVLIKNSFNFALLLFSLKYGRRKKQFYPTPLITEGQ